MKKTSIFFLIVSVVLIIAGLLLKNMGVISAKKENLELFKQTVTEKGDLLETIDFSPEDTNKINIDLSNVNINIIGNSEKSYVEIFNINALHYSAFENNRSFTVQDDFISSLVGRAESGNISFNGVRNFIRFEKHNSEKLINIYVSSDAVVKIFDIKITNGNVKIENINNVCDFNISVNNGNITCKNTPRISLFKANINNGNINLDNSHISNSDITIKNGNIDFSTPSSLVYNFDVECKAGEIKYNEEKNNGTFVTENDNKNGIFKARVGVGDIKIKTIEQNSN